MISYNFLFISFFILLLIIAFFYFRKNIRENIRENFISSNKFRGEKKGYVFKKDTKGLGYYLDLF
tara:strand:+ start:164 stop:358 length:195 start_codon:yes stop_codon:yes gene_type:complete